jgi:hypothetical protein
MRPLSTIVLALALAAMVCFSSQAFAATILFQDNFDGHNLHDKIINVLPPVGGDYLGSADGGSTTYGEVMNSATTGLSGNATQFLTPHGGAGVWVACNLTLDDTALTAGNVVTYQWNQIVTGGSTGFGQEVGAYTNPVTGGGNAFDICLYRNGTIKTFQSSDANFVTRAGTFALDQWIPITVVADYGAQTYSANVGGVTWSDVFNKSTLTGGKFQMSPSFNTSVDNLVISLGAPVVPEPSTLVLATVGILGLLAYAWRKRK